MFGKRYDPEEIANSLATALLPSCVDQVTDYINAVRLDAAERKRLMFSIFLFSVAASEGIVRTTTNVEFKTALLKAHTTYLERHRCTEDLGNLGELIIWEIERKFVIRELKVRFGLAVDQSTFDDHAIRNGTLLGIAADFRKEAFLTDIHLGMSQGQGDPRLGIQQTFKSLGTSFTRQVLDIDPNTSDLSHEQHERFHRSVAYASKFLGLGYFNVLDSLKRISE